MKSSYGKFAAMVATSTVLMFGLMYLNTYRQTDVFWSETRAYMAVLMGAAMAFVMLLFTWKMHANTKANIAIAGGSVVVFAAALYLVRSQQTVDDVDYMRGMIPHHSIAVLTSKRAHLEDARVRRLADDIVATQNREIAEMKALIADIEAHGARHEAARP